MRLLVIFAFMYVLVNTCMHSARGQKLNLNGLTRNYYKNKTTCVDAEDIIRQELTKAWNADRSISAGLLRLLYSDCLVTGCDASILLDGNTTERTAPQNFGLRGFEVIDSIKQKLESTPVCKGIVSCADIMHLATRDAVALAGGPNYLVFTGRRDGNSSKAETVDLPSPYVSWDDAVSYFKNRSLDELDLGTLLGAHTIGATHCYNVHRRIYNYNDTGMPDETMNCALARRISKICPYECIPGQPDPTVYLNPNQGDKYNFTNTYYARALTSRAVLKIDQAFLTNVNATTIAAQYALKQDVFFMFFGFSISRMGSTGVLTGSKGEIRQNCRAVNPKN